MAQISKMDQQMRTEVVIKYKRQIKLLLYGESTSTKLVIVSSYILKRVTIQSTKCLSFGHLIHTIHFEMGNLFNGKYSVPHVVDILGVEEENTISMTIVS